MMIKKKFIQFIIDVKDILLNNEKTEEKNLTLQAERVVSILGSTFSVKEQSDMVQQIRIKLIERRKDDIEKAKEHLDMLKADLEKLETTQ